MFPYAQKAYGNIKTGYSPLNCQPRSKIDLLVGNYKGYV